MSDNELASNQPSEWFVRRGNKEHGPFSSKQMRAMATSGKVMADDMVRKGRSGKWAKAASIKGLFQSSEGHPASSTATLSPDSPAIDPSMDKPKKVRNILLGCAGAFMLMILVCSGLMHLGSTARDVESNAVEQARNTKPVDDQDELEPPLGVQIHLPTLNAKESTAGPNGEPLLIGGDGKGSDSWYQYYVAASGKEVKHGKLHRPWSWNDGTGRGRIEADYEDGVLHRQIGWNGAGNAVDTLVRQDDGTYLWEEIRLIWKDVQVYYRSVATMTDGKLKSVEDLEAVLIIGGKAQDRSTQYVLGFAKGVRVAQPDEEKIKEAERRADANVIKQTSQLARETVEHYRRSAAEQLEVGGNSELLYGMADGVAYGYRQIGVPL